MMSLAHCWCTRQPRGYTMLIGYEGLPNTCRRTTSRPGNGTGGFALRPWQCGRPVHLPRAVRCGFISAGVNHRCGSNVHFCQPVAGLCFAAAGSHSRPEQCAGGGTGIASVCRMGHWHCMGCVCAVPDNRHGAVPAPSAVIHPERYT